MPTNGRNTTPHGPTRTPPHATAVRTELVSPDQPTGHRSQTLLPYTALAEAGVDWAQ
ncbi:MULTISPECIES: hypothetical protein [unclassified Streptomyces]|uniref:hypothetical protein n=1 Tax=unclassified Streptomyces TaxID=2593676 RepID=UPI00131D72D3|nr:MULTISPECIES: hypothetical protein [unclassified Streptomyces]